jgi:thioredoxin reductase
MSLVLLACVMSARSLCMWCERFPTRKIQVNAMFPPLVGIPFHRNARIVDIVGRTRVEAVRIQRGSIVETLECDGVLFTGQFTPEASLFQMSGPGTDKGSSGPAVDQDGRCENPIYFAAGNVLRGVETGGWAYREGRAVGRAFAADLGLGLSSDPNTEHL